MKKLIIAFAAVMTFAACGNQGGDNSTPTIDSTSVVKDTTVNVSGDSDTTTSGGSKDNELIIK